MATDPLSARIQRYHADVQAADDAHTLARTRLQEAFAADVKALVAPADPVEEVRAGITDIKAGRVREIQSAYDLLYSKPDMDSLIKVSQKQDAAIFDAVKRARQQH